MAKKKVNTGVKTSGKSVSAKQVPVGVKIISVLEYIGAAADLIIGLLLILFARRISPMLPRLGMLGAGFLVFFGIICVGVAVLYYFIARGLWRAQKWARIIMIVFSCIGVLAGLIGLFRGGMLRGLIAIIISGIIGGYLWFAPEVKKAFA